VTEPRPCKTCGARPEKVRRNGAPLGRCTQCISDAADRAPIGTVSAIDNGARYRKKVAAGKWVACDADGNELGVYVRGRLDEIIAKYNLVPAGAMFDGQPDNVVRLPVGTGPLSRVDDHDTSVAAGEAIGSDEERRMRQQLVVLRTIPSVFDEPNGITDGHAALKAGIHPGSFSKRRVELERRGLVACTGEGTSPYGRRSKVWTRTAEGERTLAGVMALVEVPS